ncbi:hypothetical protein DPMN_191574 [Dreissena polymorpha]|uniref:Uncharacterized protein n=1 Tax=Dreissena polymorpha TaxID=45954 RepID=A0A9D3Y5N5_DREPO|nr:hypothetical protein DPMN_191574 [Dreissena polymorpha]
MSTLKTLSFFGSQEILVSWRTSNDDPWLGFDTPPGTTRCAPWHVRARSPSRQSEEKLDGH